MPIPPPANVLVGVETKEGETMTAQETAEDVVALCDHHVSRCALDAAKQTEKEEEK